MSERLRQFVLEVSNDPDRARRLTADPTTELDQTDLSAEEKQVILSRNPDALRDALGMGRFDLLQMNSFFKEPAAPAAPVSAPARRRPRKPAVRKPGKKTPARKAPAKKKGAVRKPARKAPAKKRGGARKPARKRSRGRRG